MTTVAASVGPRGRGGNAAGKWSAFAVVAGFEAAVAYVVPALLLGEPRALSDPRYAEGWGGTLAFLVGLQVLFLQPLRSPSAAGRGRPLWLTATVGAVAGAMLVTAAALTLFGALQVGRGADTGLHAPRPWFFLAVGVAAWLVWTPLLLGFLAKRGGGVDALRRLASRLLLGTGIEVAATLPVDVLVRARSKCYCGEATYFSLILALSAGFLAFGPAVFLSLLRRRSRFSHGLCDACGEPIPSPPRPLRCPHCGAGWAE